MIITFERMQEIQKIISEYEKEKPEELLRVTAEAIAPMLQIRPDELLEFYRELNRQKLKNCISSF